MNKLKGLLIAALSVAFVGSTAGAVYAETEPTAPETDKQVAVEGLNASDYIGREANITENEASFTASGVTYTIPGADTVGGNEAWKYKAKMPRADAVSSAAFSFKTNDVITVTLSAKYYTATGEEVAKSQKGSALDIFIHNKAGDAQIGGLRIWTDSWGATNHSHSIVVYGSGWENIITATNAHIKGDATAESEFTLSIDKTNFISVMNNDGDMVRAATDEGTAARTAAMAGVDEVYLLVCGDNGFTKNMEVTVKAINGQSLASTDGKITDNVAPVFDNASVPSTVPLGAETELPVNAYDLLGDVTYSIKVGDGEVAEGKAFTPTEPTAPETPLEVTLYATDSAGNVAQRSFEFTVENVDAPAITSLPQIQGGEVKLLSKITFGKPVFTDATGVATTVCKIYAGNADIATDEPIATMTENINHEFVYFVDAKFTAGNYKVVYEITNVGGTTVSEPVEVAYTVADIDIPEYIHPQSNKMLAEMTDKGIMLSTAINDRIFFLDGMYDLSEGLDVKFVYNKQTSIGTENSATFIALRLENVDNPKYKSFFRVWLNQSGPDNPTNAYTIVPSNPDDPDSDTVFNDYTDCGWISRNTDEIEGQFHMGFNMDDTYYAERLGGVQKISNEKGGYDGMAAFIAACPSTRFKVGFEISNASKLDELYYEILLTEVNGQRFDSANIEWQDAYLNVQSDMPKMIAKDDTLDITAYAKDFRAETPLKLAVTKPDGTTANVDFEGREVSYLFDTLGKYKLAVSTVGANGKTVKQEFDIECKDSVEPVTITLGGTYKESYNLGESVQIVAATYSENAVTKTITVKLPDGSTKTVNAGDSFKFDKPGIYTVTYLARDGQTVPNEGKVEVVINVPDTQKPVIEITVGSVSKGATVKPEIKVTDDSDCDITVTLTKPDGTSVRLSASNGYEFTADATGEYKIKVEASDAYGNEESAEKVIKVSDAKKKGGCKSATGGVAAMAALTLTAAAAIVLRKKISK